MTTNNTERDTFEAWCLHTNEGNCCPQDLKKDLLKFYENASVQHDWMVWQACATSPAPISDSGASFQQRVQPWLMQCFGEMIAGDREERNHRFIEEALELIQACGCSASEAHQLVDYVFGRPVGEKHQEVGGVMVTLAALCLANDLDMHVAGETELARIWTKVEVIRAKQAAKPKHSPLPTAPDSPALASANSASDALPARNAETCRATCDICWSEHGSPWPCAKSNKARGKK